MKLFFKSNKLFAANNRIEKRLTAESLSASENRFRALFLASRDAIMTLEPPSWKFTTANPATLKMFRAKSEKQFLSYEPWKLSPELQPDGKPSSVKAKKMIETAMRDGSNLFEWTHKRLNGEDFFAEVLLSRVKIGENIFLNAVVRDITERKKIEAQLREYAEERFRVIFNNSSDGIAMIDAETKRFALANNAFYRQLGYSPEQLVKLSVPDIHPKESLGYVFSQIDLQLRGKISLAHNIPVKRHDGSIFYADINSSRIALHGRGYLLGIFRDISERKKDEMALRASLSLLTSIGESIFSAILVVNLERRITYYNENFIKLWGIPNKIMESDNERKLLKYSAAKLASPGAFIDKVNDLYDRRDGKMQEEILLSDGRIIEAISLPQFDDDKIIGRVWNFRDVTHHRHLETAMASNLSRFQAIYEDSPMPIFLVGLDGRFLNVNGAAEKILGYSEKEFLKMTFGDITHPDEAQRDINKIKELINGKINAYQVEKRYIRKDKRIIYVRINATLIRDAAKKPLHFLTIVEDITDHHEYLEKIRQSEIKYSVLVENSNDAVLVIQDGLYAFANKSSEAITGYKAKDVLGKPLMDFVAPKFKRIVLDMYTRRMKGEQVASRYEFDIIRRDGSFMPIEVNTSVVEYEGRPAVMAIIRDMTKAKEIDKVKSEFIAVASHQLRTPLTGIKWYSQLLLADKTAPLNDTQKDYLKGIFDSNERMIKLINDLLDVSHIETGRKFSVVKKKSDIVAIIKRVAKSEAVCHGTYKVRIEFDKKLPAKLIVPADEKKIEQVFMNLIGNAIKYSGSGDKVIIGAEKRFGDAQFYIRDFGLGIPKSQQNRIFEKFFRADNIATISQEGTGLGLYIAKSIIEGHGGEIGFESKENKGTTFYFTLPLK